MSSVDLTNETMQRPNGYITPKEAQPLFESLPTVNAIRDWMKKGVPDVRRPGERILLKHRREGTIFLTRPEWIDEFKQACQANSRRQ